MDSLKKKLYSFNKLGINFQKRWINKGVKKQSLRYYNRNKNINIIRLIRKMNFFYFEKFYWNIRTKMIKIKIYI